MTTMSGASVQSGNRSEAESVLQERFGRLSTMMAKGASAEELLEFLYWPEVVIAGEGLGKAYRGLEDLLPLAREYVAQMGKDCIPTLIMISNSLCIASSKAMTVIKRFLVLTSLTSRPT